MYIGAHRCKCGNRCIKRLYIGFSYDAIRTHRFDVPFVVRVARTELVLAFAEAEEIGDAEAVAAADALVGGSDVFKVPERLYIEVQCEGIEGVSSQCETNLTNYFATLKYMMTLPRTRR